MCFRRLTRRWKLRSQSPPSSSRRETGFWSSASLRGESKQRIRRSRTIGSSTLPFEMANWRTSGSMSTRKHWRGPPRRPRAPGSDPSTPIPHETIRKVNDGGSIIMTGSVASVKGFPGFGVYSASKAALGSFARTWLNELKGRNIRVNVLSSGQVDTPDSQRLDKATREMFESLIPRGKMGRPEELAAVALFLASDESSYVNGVDLAVDGGFSAI